MNPWFAFILGLLIGWLIEWLIDFFYWRRHHVEKETVYVAQAPSVRSDASIKAAIIKVDPPNTQVEITGGSVCEPVANHAYLWWQIQLPDGTQSWSAEMPLNNTNYFLEPVQ